MKYDVSKTITGKYVVHYECPNCTASLKSSLEDAGSSDTCPDCDAEFDVPGQKELRQFERLREADEQKRRAVAKQRAEDRDAEKQSREELNRQHRLKRQREEEEARKRLAAGARKVTRADRFLNLAFSFGKYVSVLVVGIALIVSIYSAAVAILTQPSVTPVPTLPPSPTFETFRDSVTNKTVLPQDTKPDRNDGPEAESVARLARLLSYFNVSFREITQWMQQIPSEHQVTFMHDFREFLEDVRKSDLPRKEQYEAPAWFHEQHMLAAMERDSIIADNTAARDAAAATKRSAMSLAFAAIGTLVVFLIIPLLIRIEQNTRATALQD